MISVPSSFATHTSVTSLPPPALYRTPRTTPIAVRHRSGAGRRLARRQVAARLVRRGRLAGHGRVGTGQQGQDLAHGAFPGGGLWQREVGLDVVAVAAAVLLLDHVAGLDQVRDDAKRAAFGNVQAGRDVAQALSGVVRDEKQNPRMVRQEGPARHADKLSDSGKFMLVS